MKNYLCSLVGLLVCWEALCSVDSNIIPRIPDDILKTFSICMYEFNYFLSGKRLNFVWKCIFRFDSVSNELKCGATTRFRKVTLRNPAKQVTDCIYTIKPSSSKVCQVSGHSNEPRLRKIREADAILSRIEVIQIHFASLLIKAAP